MKKLFSLFVMALLVLSVTPAVFAVDLGAGIDVDISIEDSPPSIWMCDHRTVYDDYTEPGRITGGEEEMAERIGNYAFEGEQIEWKVLVMDKNKIESVDVFLAGDVETDPRTECKILGWHPEKIPSSCNARLGEETLEDFDSDTMAFYYCTYTVQDSEVDSGESYITAEVEDETGEYSDMAEGEYWFLNPEIYLSVSGPISFTDVRPGTTVYSDSFQVKNGAPDGSQVALDMFIYGDDFEGSGNCPDTNQLSLTNFAYYATHGAYSTRTDTRGADAEGYLPINYGDEFSSLFYGNREVLTTGPTTGPYHQSNILNANDWFSVVLRLDVPEPCNGYFDQGQIVFWGEAI